MMTHRYFSTLLLLMITLSCISFQNHKNTEESTTYYFIRHAEKELNGGNNPDLTQEGKDRTREWISYFANKNINFVFIPFTL